MNPPEQRAAQRAHTHDLIGTLERTTGAGLQHVHLARSGIALGAVLSSVVELTKRAADSSLRADSNETGALWWENAALHEAAFGNSAEAKQVAAEGVKLYPASQAMEMESALGYALTSDSTRALWHKT